MLKLKSKARVVHFQGRKEFHGKDRVQAVTVKLQFENVKSTVASAFVSQIELMFDSNDDPAMPEVAPLGLLREISNVQASIGDVELKGADITDVVITPMRKRTCSIDLKLSCQATGVLDALHRYLDERVSVELTERELKLEEAPQPA